MIQNCRGQVSHSKVSMQTYSHSSYNNSNSVAPQRGGFLLSCMQAVCGADIESTVTRKYSTTMDDNSSITALTHKNFDDDCRISLSRFTKKINGREVRYIRAQAILFDDNVDEAHDLFYLLKIPEPSQTTTQQQNSPAVHQVQRQQHDMSDQISQKNGHAHLPVISTGAKEQILDELSTKNIKRRNQKSAIQLLSLGQHYQQRNGGQGAFQGSTGSNQIDFVNQHTGSFTFHPQYDENPERSLGGTRNSSQPMLDISKQDDNDTGQQIVVQAQERFDTETHRHRDDIDRPPSNFHMEVSSSSSHHIFLDRSPIAMAAVSNQNMMPRLPRTYGELIAKYTVQVKRDRANGLDNNAIGCFSLNKVPDGKYRIYYFRPKNRNRVAGGVWSNSCQAQDRIQKVGKGQEFYIFDKNSSESPSKQSNEVSQHSSVGPNLNSTEEQAQNKSWRFLISQTKGQQASCQAKT